jgi:hypothetical protein
MASGVFNKGKQALCGLMVQNAIGGTALAGGAFKVHLYDNTTWAEDIDLDDITALEAAGAVEASGGSYAAADAARNSTDFDVNDVDDTNDRGNFQMADKSWTAVTTSITGIYYAILTDANATAGSRILFVFWDLSGPITVTADSTLTIKDAEVRVT